MDVAKYVSSIASVRNVHGHVDVRIMVVQRLYLQLSGDTSACNFDSHISSERLAGGKFVEHGYYQSYRETDDDSFF